MEEAKLPEPFCTLRLDRIGGAADVAQDAQDAEMWAYGCEEAFTADQMLAYGRECARIAVEAERERCAKLCDAIYADEQDEPECYGFAKECAAAIRKP